MPAEPSPKAKDAKTRHPVATPDPAAEATAPLFAPGLRRSLAERAWRNAGWAFGTLCLFFSTCQMVRHADAVRDKGTVFNVAKDGIYWGKLTGLTPDSPVYEEFLRTVVRARFHLTPQGVKEPKLAQAIFVGEAAAQVKREIDAWINRASAQNLYADPYITKITPFSPNGDNPVFRVEGTALVTGVAGNLAIRRSEPFSISLELAVNPKLKPDNVNVSAPFVVPTFRAIFGESEMQRARDAARER